MKTPVDYMREYHNKGCLTCEMIKGIQDEAFNEGVEAAAHHLATSFETSQDKSIGQVIADLIRDSCKKTI